MGATGCQVIGDLLHCMLHCMISSRVPSARPTYESQTIFHAAPENRRPTLPVTTAIDDFASALREEGHQGIPDQIQRSCHWAVPQAPADMLDDVGETWRSPYVASRQLLLVWATC